MVSLVKLPIEELYEIATSDLPLEYRYQAMKELHKKYYLTQHYGLVKKFVSTKFKNDIRRLPHISLDDIEQVAALGFMKAYDEYDDSRGEFSTFSFLKMASEVSHFMSVFNSQRWTKYKSFYYQSHITEKEESNIFNQMGYEDDFTSVIAKDMLKRFKEDDREIINKRMLGHTWRELGRWKQTRLKNKIQPRLQAYLDGII